MSIATTPPAHNTPAGDLTTDPSDPFADMPAAATAPAADPAAHPSTEPAGAVTRYEYLSAAGDLILTAVRTKTATGKDFRVEPVGVKPEDRVPYRLPELRDSSDPVVIVEGERKVDALRAVGVTATCNPGGAGKWLAHYSDHLRGRSAYVWPDNDLPGQRHAEQVCQSLHGIAAEVRMVSPPDYLKVKGDVVDVLARPDGVAEVRRLLAEAKPWTPSQTAQDAPGRANGKPAGANASKAGKAGSNGAGSQAAWDRVRELIRERRSCREELEGNGVPVTKHGKFSAPWREDADPSVQIYPDGRFYDFGGDHRSGDVIDLVAHFRGLPKPGEAVSALAREYGIELPHGEPRFIDPATAASTPGHGTPPDYGDVPPPTEDDAPAKGGKQKAERKESQADTLVRLALEAKTAGRLLLFTDSAGVPYAQAVVKDAGGVPEHREVYRVNGQGFKRYLSRRLFETSGKPGTADAIKTATLLLEAFACHDGPRYALSNRVAHCDDALYFDLTNGAHTAVRTTAAGWSITEPDRPTFHRFAHQLPQVDPVHGGDIWRLFDYVSVTDPDHQLLLLTWLVAAYVPGWPHPMPVLRGPQGSGKSGALGFLRRLIDPSQTATVNIPRDLEDLIQVLAHNWFCPFDNITAIHEWVNDALCRAVTGDGFSKRQLYTDDEDVIYSFQRVIGLGGITIAGMRPDLIDRCISIELARIPKERRLTEKPLKDRFERDLPKILGGIFDTLALALRYLPEVHLREHPRMADFAEFGCAVARALGKTEDDFLRAYGADQARALDEAVDADPVASAIAALMDRCPEFKGTPAEVLTRLIAEAREVGIDTDAKTWPSDARLMTRAMKRAEATLQDKGIGFVFSRDMKSRSIRIYHR